MNNIATSSLKKIAHLMVISALFSFLAGTAGYSALIDWSSGSGDWTDGGNWVGGTAPVDGDSVNIDDGAGTDDIRLNTSFTIESGQSLTSTRSGSHPELILTPAGNLTVATGGLLDVNFFRSRFGDPGGVSPQITIEPGATVNVDSWGVGPGDDYTHTWISDASLQVTEWTSGSFSLSTGLGSLVVDLTAHEFPSQYLFTDTDLILVDYDTLGGLYNDVTVLGLPSGYFATVNYVFDQGGGDLALALAIRTLPEPSTVVLLGLGGWILAWGRRRSKQAA